MKRFVLLVSIAAILAVPAFGQVPTGTLSGHVTDATGILPGVTVSTISPSLQGTRTAVTNENGDYIFRFLPPGEYTIKFELAGFQTIDTTVKVSAAQTAKVDALMPEAKVAEEVTVTGNYETISSSATASSTYESKLISNLPTARDVANYVALSPGVTVTGARNSISIGGAGTYESLFLVNGVAVTENLRGQVTPLYIEDAIEETTTSMANVSAEYGRFTGGIVNALTKSGGNEFHGSVRDTLANPKWTAPTPKTVSRTDNIDNTYEATLGGFVLRDKLWFFAAGRTSKTTVSNQTYLTEVPFDTITDETRYEAKVTFSPVSQHRFVGSSIGRDRKWDGYYFNSYDIYDLDSVYSRKIPEDLIAFNYTGVLSDNFFVEGQYSARHMTFEGAGSRYTDLIKGTPVWDTATEAIYNSPIFCAVCEKGNEERNNSEWMVKGSWFTSASKLGSHDVRFGYDSYDDTITSNNYQSGSNYFLWANEVILQGTGRDTKFYPVILGDGNAYLEWWPIFKLSKGSHFKTNSAFVNDVWRLNNNWSFNLGVRYDMNDGTNASGVKVVKDSKISPRIAVTWDPKGNGEWQLNFGVGKYVAAITTNAGDASATGGAPAYYNIIYSGPDINANGAQYETAQALQMVFNWLDGIGGVLANPDMWGPYSPSVPGYQTFVGDNLKSPSVDEITVGVTKRLGTKGLVRMDLIDRTWADFYSTRIDMTTGKATDPNGLVYDRNLVENDNRLAKRTYRGALLQGQYRLNDRLSLGANYTYSKAEGNFEGETSGSGPVTSAMRSYPEYLQMRWFAPTGPLAVDQTHRATLFATYDVVDSKHNRLTASVMQRYLSGTPYSAASANGAKVGDYVTNPGYDNAPDMQTYFFSKRGAYRTDAVTSTDLSLNYAFKLEAFGSNLEFYLIPQITNVFNHRVVTQPNTTVWTRYNKSYLAWFDPFTATPKECPQGASSSTCSEMGANWQKGTSFGKGTSPTSYQIPRTFGLAFGVRF